MTLYTHQNSNVAKTWALMTVFLILIIAIGFVLSQLQGDPTILYIAVVISIVMNIAGYWFSDKVALASTRARPADETEFRELHRLVENLAITAGLPKPRVYIIDDPAPNAFATGRDKEHAAVAVTTGILGILDRSELEGVIAHELSHIGNRDMLVSTVAVILAGTIALVSDLLLRTGFRGSRREGGGIFAIIGLAVAILAPIAATLMQLAISRKREYLADATGALLTRYPEGLASALEKISGYGEPMRSASDATAHLFISNPFGRKVGIMHSLFSTHPPIQKRVAILRNMQIDA